MALTIINPPSGTVNPGAKARSEAVCMDAGQAGQVSFKKRNDLRPDLKLIDFAVNEIKTANPVVRKLSNRQVGKAMRSIEAFGFRVPVLLSTDNEAIDGHVRIEAARQLGLKSVPAIRCADLTEVEVRALRIAVNRTQETGEWDEQVLRLEFEYLLAEDFDLTITGFEIPEIDRILVLDGDGAGEADPLDNVSRQEGPVISIPGDVWLLGPHRICCGNARDAALMKKMVGDETVDAVFTDPPYNVPVNGHVRVERGKFAEFGEASGEMSQSEYREFLHQTSANMASVVKPGGILFLCIDWRHDHVLRTVLAGVGLDLLNVCVWAKDRPGMGSFYRSQHEFVLVARRPGASHMNNVQLGKHGRNRSNIWRFAGATGGASAAEDDFSLHPTVKPVRLVRDAILDVTAIDEVVLDPFLGSGSTLLAAELARRVCLGVELSPAYVDVAVRRWEEMTGRTAVHAETGMGFAEVGAQRRAASDEVPGASTHPPSPKPTPTEEDF